MERQQSPQDVTWFLDLNKKSQIDFDPPYQRKSVWTRRDKQFFLDTIFHNYPCPSVFLHKSVDDNGEVSYHVVDGKQRLQTIIEFAADQIAIPDNFGDTRLNGKKFSQLDIDAKKQFWNYRITVEMLPTVENSFVNDVFDRINRNSRRLTRQELRHAKFDGWMCTYAEAEADKQEWKDFGVVTTARAKRMNDVQFISEIIILSVRGEVVGFDQDAIDKFYAQYDVPAETVPTFNEEEFTGSFEATKRFLVHMNEHNGCVTQYGRTLAHFYSLWSYVHLVKGEDASAADVAARYAEFMEKVVRSLEGGLPPAATPQDGQDQASPDPVTRYALNVRGANTDTTPRRERHAALSAALNS